MTNVVFTPTAGPLRHRLCRAALMVALPLAAALVSPNLRAIAADGESPEGIYAFQVRLAPVCLDGTFPLTLTSDEGPVSGSVTVTTDSMGRVTGEATLRGLPYTASGKVTYRTKGHKLSLKLKHGKDRVTLKGGFEIDAFTGTSKGKGAVAPGKHTFDLDLSASEPQVAYLVADLAAGRGKSFSGTGEVQVCGEPLPLSAKATNGKSFKLKLKGKHFSWQGTSGTFTPGLPLTWKATGYGAVAQGSTAPFAAVQPPSGLTYTTATADYEAEETIPTNAVSAGVLDNVVFSVSPPLPAGLSLHVRTGAVTGAPAVPTPQATYTVTASNPAGSVAATLDIAVHVNRAYVLTAHADALTDDEIHHLLARTQMGVRAADVQAVRAAGLAGYVDDMMVWPTGTLAEAEAFQELVNEGDPAGLEGGFPSATDVARWWMALMMKTEHPFQESLAFFWHDHFASSTEVLGGGQRHWMVNQINMLRREGKGNLRTLLLNIARDEAMLVYLDGQLNRRGAPNENFARELWELFSLGRDNGYTEADIVESAKALTGYRSRYDDVTGQYYMEFDPSRHETGDKHILGQTIVGQNVTDDYDAVIDITLANGDVAEYISKKLFEWYVYDSPPQSVVDELAAEMRGADYEIEPVLKTIFRSEAFFSRRARRNQVKSPLEFAIGFIRTTGLLTRTSTLDSNLIALGERPTQAPVVDGWPHGVAWLSAHAMVERTNHVDDVLDDTSFQSGLGIDIADILPPVAERTAESVVDTLTDLMVVELTATERAELIDYLNTVRTGGVVTPSPFDGSSQSHLDTRVRGLLWILAQHPTYQVR